MASLYRALNFHGIGPPVVDTMLPSQIAAVLGMDEIDTDSETGEPLRARPTESVPPPPRRDVDRKKSRRERLDEMARARGEEPGGTVTNLRSGEHA